MRNQAKNDKKHDISKIYWVRYVLVDQELCGGGMRSTKCPSSLVCFFPLGRAAVSGPSAKCPEPDVALRICVSVCCLFCTRSMLFGAVVKAIGSLMRGYPTQGGGNTSILDIKKTISKLFCISFVLFKRESKDCAASTATMAGQQLRGACPLPCGGAICSA